MSQEMTSWQLQWYIQAAVPASEIVVPIHSCHQIAGSVLMYAGQVLLGIHVDRVSHKPPTRRLAFVFVLAEERKFVHCRDDFVLNVARRRVSADCADCADLVLYCGRGRVEMG
jgi:hypothetical protein